METTIIQRIELIAKAKSLSLLKFAKVIDFNYPTLNNYTTGRRKAIDIELICKILTTFPDVSAEWLLLEIGSMFKDVLEVKTAIPIETTNEMMLKTIIELSGKNAVLEEKIKEIEKERGYQMAAEPVKKYSKH
jgi:transcriptional regulator with XRE-family HTH domain